MKNSFNTSFLHQVHFFHFVLITSVLILLLQAHTAQAQSPREELPTVKILKKRPETREIKQPTGSGKTRETYRGPKTSPHPSKQKDNYQRPESLRKAEKSKDKYERPASATVDYNTTPQQNQNPAPPYEEGQSDTKVSLWKRTFGKSTPHTFEGNLKRAAKDQATEGTDYQGSIRRAPQKRLERQFQYRAQYYSLYSGEIKLPTLNAKTRSAKKLSAKVHQYDGDIRYRKPGKDMHPSAFYLKSKTKNSYEQKENYRRWRLTLSHIFDKSDQPKRVTEKKHKPRYDKDESEIWNY